MNKVLVSILMMICFSVNGQDVGSHTIVFKSQPEPDTVRVLMLVGDTSHLTSSSYEAMPCTDSCDKKEHRFSIHAVEKIVDMGNRGFGQCFWVYGHSVYKIYSITEYLDDKKQPLKKGLVVWISTTLK